MRAVVYLRISQDRTGEEYGVDRQRQDCLVIAERRGWTVVAVLVENDTSATKGKRPLWEQLMQMIDDGEVDVVIGWTVDRVLRSGRDRLRMLEAGKAKGITISLVRGSDMDLSTPSGRLAADILGAVALAEVEMKADRQQRAQLQAAQLGKRVGGRRPFGYERDGMTVRATEARAIRQAYADVLAGVPLGAIARRWNRDGLLTGKKRRTEGHKGELSAWTHTTVRRLLANPRNAGIRRYRGEEIGPAGWPALVSEELFRAACTVLRDPARDRGGSGMEGRQLLTGIALCANAGCGLTVHGGGAGHGKPIYRCRCDAAGNVRSPGVHVNRLADPADDYVARVVVARLARPDAVDLLAADDDDRPDVPALRERAAVLRRRLTDMAVEFADGDLTALQLRTATERVRAKLAETEAELAEAGRASVLVPLLAAEDVEAEWRTLDVDRRRAVIDALMIVRLHPPGRGSRTFDPMTVEIEWRTPTQ